MSGGRTLPAIVTENFTVSKKRTDRSNRYELQCNHYSVVKINWRVGWRKAGLKLRTSCKCNLNDITESILMPYLASGLIGTDGTDGTDTEFPNSNTQTGPDILPNSAVQTRRTRRRLVLAGMLHDSRCSLHWLYWHFILGMLSTTSSSGEYRIALRIFLCQCANAPRWRAFWSTDNN